MPRKLRRKRDSATCPPFLFLSLSLSLSAPPRFIIIQSGTKHFFSFPARLQRPDASLREPRGPLLPAHVGGLAAADLRADEELRRVEGQAGVREGAPGAAPLVRHPRLYRGGGTNFKFQFHFWQFAFSLNREMRRVRLFGP